MFTLAHITGYETSTILATFAFGVVVGVFGSYCVRFIRLHRIR